MTERPILFGGEMVRAILAGTKTQTRRVVKPAPIDGSWICAMVKSAVNMEEMPWLSPYGVRGDRLWVREAWRPEELEPNMLDGVRFRADESFVKIENTIEAADAWVQVHDRKRNGWRPSIYMPRWACRLELDVAAVSVQRLQDITEEDSFAEGIAARRGASRQETMPTAKEVFRSLWDEINGKRGYPWSSNPWVWVIEFRKAS